MASKITHDLVGDAVIDLLGLADVKRWNVVRTLKDQNVASHAFAVAVIATDLITRLTDWAHGSHNHCQVLWWSLIHDVPETLTGDIDGKFKRSHPTVRSAVCEAENKEFPWFEMYASAVSPEAKAIVKLADRIEALRFIQDWGHGARADDVYHENNKALFEEVVPWAGAILMLDNDVVTEAVRFTLHHSTDESNSIQLRRHRQAVADSPSGAGA